MPETILRTDLSALCDYEDAKLHDAFQAFETSMVGRAYGSEALNDAWHWFRDGWDAAIEYGGVAE